MQLFKGRYRISSSIFSKADGFAISGNFYFLSSLSCGDLDSVHNYFPILHMRLFWANNHFEVAKQGGHYCESRVSSYQAVESGNREKVLNHVYVVSGVFATIETDICQVRCRFSKLFGNFCGIRVVGHDKGVDGGWSKWRLSSLKELI